MKQFIISKNLKNKKPIVDYYQTIYNDQLKQYSDDLLYGVSTTAQQIIQLDTIAATLATLTDEKS